MDAQSLQAAIVQRVVQCGNAGLPKTSANGYLEKFHTISQRIQHYLLNTTAPKALVNQNELCP